MAYEGYVYEESASGAGVDVSMNTAEVAGKNIFQQKQLKYIYYDTNTHGKDVTLTVYIDGVAQSPTFTVNTSSRESGRIEDIPLSWQGYTFNILASCSDVTDTDLEIYAPISLLLTPVGV